MLSADPDGRVRGFLRYGSEVDQAYRPPKLFQLLAPYTRTWTSALFRREALELLGGLKKETGYSFSIDLILRSATRFEAVLSDAPCAVFTVHSGSSSVAEASKAFESLLNLVFFDSVNQAIDSALMDNIVSGRDAGKMKAALRTVAEHNFFRGAFGLIARGDLAVAFQASEVLADHFERKDMAAMINAAAMDNGLGVALRLAIRSAKAVRKLWHARNGTVRYPEYSEMVKSRMLELNG
jgi:hypothetical protein